MLTSTQQEALAILQNRTWRSFRGLTRHSEMKRIKLLSEKLSTTEPMDLIGPLSAVIYHGSDELCAVLSPLWKKLVDEISPREWFDVDEAIRSEILALTYQIQHVGKIPRRRAMNSDVIRSISMSHPSGYTRESAINSIIMYKNGYLRELIVRCSDWVDPVAQYAREKLLKQLKLLDEASLMMILPALERLTLQSRFERGEFKEEFYQVLASKKHLPSLLRSLKVNNCQVSKLFIARFLITKAKEISPDDFTVIFDSGLPVQKMQALQVYASLYPQANMEELLLKLITSSWSPLRRQALRMLIKQGYSEIKPLLFNALSDKSESIRSLARFHLKILGEQSFQDHYLDLLRTPLALTKFRSSLYGLSEVASIDAHNFALKHLSTANLVGEIKSCINCLILNESTVTEEDLFRWLLSDHIGISYSVFQAIMKQEYILPEDRLMMILGDSNAPRFVQDFAYRLLTKTSKWNALIVHLHALNHSVDRIFERALNDLEKWHKGSYYSFITPKKNQLDKAQGLLEKYHAKVPEWLFRELSSLLKNSQNM